MKTYLGRKKLTAVALMLLLAGLLTPVFVVGASGSSGQDRSQISSLIAAAEGSGLYARSLIGFATSHGLAVAASQALLSQGDSSLSAAEADETSSVAEGVLSAQAAMRDYTSAAASASLTITRAGLAVGVDYTVVEQAIAEVNATVIAAASVSSVACAQASGSTSGGTALAQACAQLDASIAGAGASLDQAAALSAQASGRANATVGFSQAMTLVAAARAEIGSTQAEFQTIAGYGYSQRAGAYVTSVVGPLSAQANATVSAEGSVNSSYNQFSASYVAYAQAHESAVGEVTASASALAAAIGSVNFDSVSSSAATADEVAAQVGSNLSALLALPGIAALTSVVADVSACQSLSGSFTQDVNAAATESVAYQQTDLPSFATYASLVAQDASNVQASGSAYVSACNKVVADLSGLQGIAGVSAIYDNLVSLQVSGSAGGIETSLAQETSEMATVQADIAAFTSVVASQIPSVNMSRSLLDASTSLNSSARAFLNATGSAALSQASRSVSAVWWSELSLAVEVSSITTANIGTFVTQEAALVIGANDTAVVNGAASAIANASAYLRSDLASRISGALAAQGEVATAMRLFTSLDIAGGASAMAQASLDFQAAASLNAQ